MHNGSQDLKALEVAVAWSIACEPGDEFAGFLRETLSSELPLNLIRTNAVNDLLAALDEVSALETAHHRFGDVRSAITHAIERYLPRLQGNSVNQALAVLEANRGWALLPSSEQWPRGLNDLGWAAPPMLWGIGDRSTLPRLQRSVSVVGSRGATGYGDWVTTDLCCDLAERGYAIVSGGAYGIDGIAHRATLNASGTTFAVMAGGVNRFYPSGHAELLGKVAESGAVLSELAPNAMPTKWRFLQRNRLVAALSQVTVVVEAGKRSGSISTANHAESLSRPVAAIPGPVTSSASVGTNRLIAEGFATLVTCGADVAVLAGDRETLDLSQAWDDLGDIEKRALDAIGKRPLTSSEIASQAGLAQSEVAIALANLQMLGQVRQVQDKWARALAL